MMQSSLINYYIYLAKYLGVALVSGSVVHMGTLSSEFTRYAILGIIGLVVMIVGSALEARREGKAVDVSFVGIVTLLAVGTGFMSGGIQHYFDNPVYAGVLLALGLFLSFVFFFKKEGIAIARTALVTVCVLAAALGAFSIFVANEYLGPHAALDGHH